jgi:hypothetical protein
MRLPDTYFYHITAEFLFNTAAPASLTLNSPNPITVPKLAAFNPTLLLGTRAADIDEERQKQRQACGCHHTHHRQYSQRTSSDPHVEPSS